MSLMEYALGAFFGRNTKKMPGTPGEPLYNAVIRANHNEIGVTVGERETSGDHKSTRYDISLSGKPSGTYRVRQKGNLLSEMLFAGEGHVIRNLFLNNEDAFVNSDGGLSNVNFEGTHFDDIVRYVRNLKSAGRIVLDYPGALNGYPRLQQCVIKRKIKNTLKKDV